MVIRVCRCCKGQRHQGATNKTRYLGRNLADLTQLSIPDAAFSRLLMWKGLI